MILLTYDLHEIGERLYEIRKKRGLTQAQVAEGADIADRTYAEMERGILNIRLTTFLRICDALSITPDKVLCVKDAFAAQEEAELLSRLSSVREEERKTAMRLLGVYLDSIS